MAEPFVGEIRLFSYNRIPQGWLPCNGQLLNIQQNMALYALLSTKFGGDGKTTFALPNLQGRVPIHPNNANPNLAYAASGGESAHTLTLKEIPIHDHQVYASSVAATTAAPGGAVWGSQANQFAPASDPGTLVPLNANAYAAAGGSAAHSNMQPYLTVSYCIATTGIYPSRS
ncbi:phage tail protein [Tumebacillus sp. ITR2]|uniref:Phage tail protein n=1 Tax=Tumebacillus amylolyticus TaxID=2801339 RepID=A0ABS1J762_9BACL|nr:tail fiber protein [Tumebacillus amylolyticus]MBL0385894.1 phage tail protein [Tumebacillus amylolyticus]